MTEHVLIVGAGIGGLRTAEGLRAAGYPGRISLVGDEPHPPYDRPPLSKQVLTGAWEPDRAVLRDAAAVAELGVRAHLGLAAVALHRGAVELANGATLHADAIVVATGMAARRLPDQPAGTHTLRTLDDAVALRAALAGARSLLLVGGGFIGAEVAAAARAAGLAVTVLEALPVPFARALGPQVGALAGRVLVEAGVDLRSGIGPARFAGPTAVALGDGTRVEADVVVVGVGGVPRLEWLRATAFGRSLDTADGLACDAAGRVLGRDGAVVPGLWAVGDVAAWTRDGARHRVEHWTNAGDQATAVARAIAGAEPPPAAVPYFWSDQFGLKIQLVGRPERADEVLPLHGTGLTGGPVRGTVAAYLADGRLAAVVGFSAARLVARYRALVLAGADRAAVLALAAELG